MAKAYLKFLEKVANTKVDKNRIKRIKFRAIIAFYNKTR